MIYLTKSFTCVIVSGWCDQVGFESVFEDVKAWRIASLLWKFIPIADSRRKMYSKDENSYVTFLDLKSYVKGMLTRCHQ